MKQTEQIPRTLGQYIEQGMERDGRTRDQIAKAARIDGSYLSRIKAGHAIPSFKVLKALARELKLDLQVASQLAEASELEQDVEEIQEKLTLLEKQAPGTLGRVFTGLPREQPLSPLLDEVYQSFLEDWWVAAGSGTPVLVVDSQHGTAWDLPMDVQGPELDAEGNIYFHLRTERWEDLPEECFVELILLFALPVPESVQSMRLGHQERQQLGTPDGLEFQAKLPDSPTRGRLLKSTERALQREGQNRRPIGLKGGFAFRIRG